MCIGVCYKPSLQSLYFRNEKSEAGRIKAELLSQEEDGEKHRPPSVKFARPGDLWHSSSDWNIPCVHSSIIITECEVPRSKKRYLILLRKERLHSIGAAVMD